MPRPKKERPNHAGGLYEVKITIGKNVDGKLRRKSFYSSISRDDARRQAEEWKIQREVANRTGVGFVDQRRTFSEWADQWLEIYKKPNVTENTYNGTYKLYVEQHLKPYFGQAELSSIRPADIQRFYAGKRSLSPSALHKIALCLNGIFETAIDNDLCVKNPTRSVTYTSEKTPQVKQAYTEEQQRSLCRLIRKTNPAIVLLLETGLRCGELCGLQWDDIYDGLIHVKRSVAVNKSKGYELRPPKWNSYREIPITPKARNALRRLSNDDIYILPADRHKPDTPRTWAKILSRHMGHIHAEYPDIPILSAHELRHTFGTRLRRRGVDLYTIQKVMGHKDINITAGTYVHNEVDQLKKAMLKRP